jgi:hypothetical protein
MPKQLHLKGMEFTERRDDALQLAVRSCTAHRRWKLFFVTFLADASAPRVIAERNGKVVKLAQREDYWVGTLRSKDRSRGRAIQFGLFQSGPTAWTAFALSEKLSQENLLLRLLRSLAPDFSTAYLSSEDMRRVFQALEGGDQCHVFVNKAVAYSHRREGQISFIKKPYFEVFNAAENEGNFIDKVDFTVSGAYSLHAFLARNGVAKFISGDFQVFFQGILSSIIKTAVGKHHAFAQSSRKPGQLAVSPIDIEFGQVVFQNRQDNVVFLSALDRMSRSAIAVLHENPYVHASLIDFFDGSAFDIFATIPNAVTIIPQVGASAFSLNRLCNHIFETFREGRLTIPEARLWTLQDVLA